MKPLKIDDAARAEFEEAADHYEQEAGLGRDFRLAVAACLMNIKENPSVGAPYGRKGFRYLTTKRFPYVVFYREYDELLWVAAIAHGRRRQGYWGKRRFDGS